LSRLISSEDLQSATQPLVALNLCDVEQKARAAVEQARAEAKRILIEALARAREMEHVAAARGEKAGYQAGLAKGREEGARQALEAETARIREATATVREALLELIQEVEAQRHEIISDAKHGLLSLSVAIAERICRTQVARSTDHLRPLVEEIIETTGKQSGLVLRVNPADAEAIKTFLADVRGVLAGDEHGLARVVVDASVAQGGCVAERHNGRTDGRLETQMTRIVSELLGADLARAEKTGDSA
jgi:flagellar biosynthesis/type III secretory pathway protein FliH